MFDKCSFQSKRPMMWHCPNLRPPYSQQGKDGSQYPSWPVSYPTLQQCRNHTAWFRPSCWWECLKAWHLQKRREDTRRSKKGREVGGGKKKDGWENDKLQQTMNGIIKCITSVHYFQFIMKIAKCLQCLQQYIQFCQLWSPFLASYNYTGLTDSAIFPRTNSGIRSLITLNTIW